VTLAVLAGITKLSHSTKNLILFSRLDLREFGVDICEELHNIEFRKNFIHITTTSNLDNPCIRTFSGTDGNSGIDNEQDKLSISNGTRKPHESEVIKGVLRCQRTESNGNLAVWVCRSLEQVVDVIKKHAVTERITAGVMWVSIIAAVMCLVVSMRAQRSISVSCVGLSFRFGVMNTKAFDSRMVSAVSGFSAE